MADNVFNSLDSMENEDAADVSSVTVEVDDEATRKKKEAQKRKNEQAKKIVEAMDATIAADPDMLNTMSRSSSSLEVTHSLGFGEGGNLILDKVNSVGKDRKLIGTSVIVGYEVKNVGADDITYATEEYAKDENGVYVGTKVEKTMHPGETINLTRKYMAMLTSRVEFSYTLKNGIIKTSSTAIQSEDLDKIYSASYFVFNKESGLEINDDSVKLNVGETDGDGKWHVKDEYVKDFGYLNNTKAPAKRAKAVAEKRYSTSQASANYIRMLTQRLQEQNG